MLWVDKYRPRKFDEFTINKDKAEALTKLVGKGARPTMERCPARAPQAA